MSEDRVPIIAITPEPSPEELVAITAAITAAIRRVADLVSAPPPSPQSSRWARQGRLESMRGLDRGASVPR